ncbi:MAG TPA: GNAT family N-acetyltransferase [Gemmataceae bacterium]|jgi:GNAT superfamily N-acetyltransferase|nr:GNAT family N-acetyltransferase [Gemmataceae bacterium]
MPKPHLVCHPVTPDRWDDFELLFGERGACAGCWCTFWRRPRAEYEQQKGDGNRRFMLQVVNDGPPPGLLGYLGNEPVGWCSVAPREDFSGLTRSRILRPMDDKPVWSISCFFVRKDQRRKGLSVQLLKAAIEHVKSEGGTIVEGYPVEPKTEKAPDPFVWHGLASAFLAAGFKEVARRSDTRPIMRFAIRRK